MRGWLRRLFEGLLHVLLRGLFAGLKFKELPHLRHELSGLPLDQYLKMHFLRSRLIPRQFHLQALQPDLHHLRRRSA
jgi:hypothetical protein